MSFVATFPDPADPSVHRWRCERCGRTGWVGAIPGNPIGPRVEKAARMHARRCKKRFGSRENSVE